MSSGISVSGGANGTEARYDSLLALAARLDHSASQLDDIADVLGSGYLREQLDAAMNISWTAGLPLTQELSAIQWLAGPGVAADLHGTAGQLRFAVGAYRNTDDGIFSDIGGFFEDVGSFIVAAGDGFEKLVTTGSPSAAFNAFATDDPGFFDFLAEDTALGLIAPLDAWLAPDGRPVVHDLGSDERTTAATPPRGVTDLMRALALRNEGRDGEISVSFLTGADGRRRAIVDLTGTKSWALTETDDITSVVTNTRAIQGESTAYERGVLDAMAAAGVARTDQVMIVGHSEGGMVAVNAARDAVRAGRFDVTHVVTAGAPLGHIAGSLPKSVQLLALEDEHDIVPHLDGCANPDEPTETTVTGGPDRNDIVANHDIARSYVPLGRQVDGSDDASVRAFLDSAAGFFDDTAMTTHAYQITRSYH